MTTIAVWYLVTMTAASGVYAPVYSPPMATEAECVRVQKAIKEVTPVVRHNHYSRCVQINELVKK